MTNSTLTPPAAVVDPPAAPAAGSACVVARPLRQGRRFKWRGAFAVVILTPAALFALVASPRVPPHSWLAVAIDGLAWTAFAAGAAFRFWATIYIGGRKNDEVVSDGPYSLCRHPLYLGSVLLVLSGALFLKSLVAALALAMLAMAYVMLTVPAEEAYLAARLGEPYRQYCRRVNRLWPSLRPIETGSRISVDVHSLYLECARAARWIWLPMLGEIVGQLRAMPWWPWFFDVP